MICRLCVAWPWPNRFRSMIINSRYRMILTNIFTKITEIFLNWSMWSSYMQMSCKRVPCLLSFPCNRHGIWYDWQFEMPTNLSLYFRYRPLNNFYLKIVRISWTIVSQTKGFHPRFRFLAVSLSVYCAWLMIRRLSQLTSHTRSHKESMSSLGDNFFFRIYLIV